MIRNIILALVAFIVVSFVVLWALGGGPKRIYNQVRGLAAASATSTSGFALPWQPAGLFPFITNEDLFGGSHEDEPSTGASATSTAGNLGTPSPFFRRVRIVGGLSYPKATLPGEEYILIEAEAYNTTPLSLEGWSVQSAVSGERSKIPGAAARFALGSVNTGTPITLNPGASAYLVSGASPVGISFQENMCTGYLSQFQAFAPALPLSCPSPSSELRLSAENLSRYGEECFTVIERLPTCHFPADVPSTAYPVCRTALQAIFSYNGCKERHLDDPAFDSGIWRVYLASPVEIWRNQHDAIRLLDAAGQVVDVYVY